MADYKPPCKYKTIATTTVKAAASISTVLLDKTTKKLVQCLEYIGDMSKLLETKSTLVVPTLIELYTSAHKAKTYGHESFYFSGTTLAKKLSVSPQTARRLIRFMIDKGYIIKTKDSWHNFNEPTQNLPAMYRITQDQYHNLLDILDQVVIKPIETVIDWDEVFGDTAVVETTTIIIEEPTIVIEPKISVPLIVYMYKYINYIITQYLININTNILILVYKQVYIFNIVRTRLIFSGLNWCGPGPPNYKTTVII